MKIPVAKLKSILRYFGTNTDPRFLGKVKLMKLFYFLDFLHVKQYGTPVTYDQYVKLEHGPVPSVIFNLVNEATNDIDNAVLADTITCERIGDPVMYRIKLNKTFDQSDEGLFKESELKVLAQVCQRFGSSNTQVIKDASHAEAPWSKTELLDYIPYMLAADDSDCLVSREDIQLLEEIG